MTPGRGILSHGTWRRAECGLLSSSGSLPVNRAVLVPIKGDMPSSDAASKSVSNSLPSIADSSFILSAQGKCSDG
jgi:hypothetical protein